MDLPFLVVVYFCHLMNGRRIGTMLNLVRLVWAARYAVLPGDPAGNNVSLFYKGSCMETCRSVGFQISIKSLEASGERCFQLAELLHHQITPITTSFIFGQGCNSGFVCFRIWLDSGY
jgi:hypothetical protein